MEPDLGVVGSEVPGVVEPGASLAGVPGVPGVPGVSRPDAVCDGSP